jgi:DNA-binding MarR family transcriptional regulator
VTSGRGARSAALPIDASLFFKLVRVVNLTARPFVETLSRAHRLSLNEWRSMVVLASHPGVAATDIVEATGLDKMSVSRALAALARQGRLLKQPDPADARRAQLTLSPAGEALYRRIGALATVREAQLFAGVSAAEQVQMGRTLDRLLAALQASEPEQA